MPVGHVLLDLEKELDQVGQPQRPSSISDDQISSCTRLAGREEVLQSGVDLPHVLAELDIRCCASTNGE
jgi:hypothetical protein